MWCFSCARWGIHRQAMWPETNVCASCARDLRAADEILRERKLADLKLGEHARETVRP